MKHFFPFLVLLCLSPIALRAQKSVFLFDDYMPGTVHMRNGAKADALLNFDASNRKVFYKEQDVIMELEGLEDVGSVTINGRSFSNINNTFIEPVKVGRETVFVFWKLKEQPIGKKGAYGMTSQTNARTYTSFALQSTATTRREVTDVTEIVCQNEYWVFQGEKILKVRDLKSFLKAFPGKEDAIKEHTESQGFEFSDPQAVLTLFEFAYTL